MGLVLSRLRRLGWRDVVEASRAAAILCRVAMRLREDKLTELVGAFRLADKLPPADAARVERAAQLVRWAHWLVPLEPNCLLDSLAAAALVRRQGFSVPLVIGVKLQQGALRAHAWLGEPGAESIEGFHLLYRVPGSDRR